jgi:hypothetical protein
MKFLSLILFFFLILSTAGLSQEKRWQVGLYPFFDNTEFGHSKVQIPQTMAGVQFSPEAGLLWDSVHSVNIGVALIHEFGSTKTIDFLYPTAYYEFKGKPFRFVMGAFPRKFVTEKYPRAFFQDSISYYRPNINGIFWEFRRKQDYFNLWLDWTSRQSPTAHEAFFMGISGRYNLGIFYVRHFGYMFHFAGTMNPSDQEALHDNGLFLTSAGLDLTGKTIFTALDVNAGWLIGLDRARSDNTGWIKQQGLLMEMRIEYKWIGIFNTFYNGSGLMHYYADHSNELYWGDPIYRAKSYNRTDFFINFINNKIVNTKLIYSLHFAENAVYHEQLLKVSFNLNNY